MKNSNNKTPLVFRILALFLAGLMVLGIVAGALIYLLS